VENGHVNLPLPLQALPCKHEQTKQQPRAVQDIFFLQDEINFENLEPVSDFKILA
jgi:hypothetical protein